MEEKSSYRNNFKTTLLFSGVQIFQIIIRIVRSKFVAMFLGTEGMGITSLLHSTTDLISAFTNLGLKTSGVKNVAAANATHDEIKIAQIGVVIRRLMFLTGLIGLIICATLSPFWSIMSFGNYDYTWSYVFISVIILLEQLNNGELVLLQGMQKKKYLAKANLIGQTIGLFVAVPLYYFFRIKAIVLVLVIHSLFSLLISKYFTNKINLPIVKVSIKDILHTGRGMINLGFFISLQYLFQMISMYIVRLFVSNIGGIDDVGLYGAGTTIINMYVGMVFAAVATDYFPRLAGTQDNKTLCFSMRQQAEITILMLAPIIVAFIIFIKPIILILYSEQFLPIEHMLYLGMAAMLIKAMGWALSFSILAKSTSKVFFLNEFIAIIYTLICNIGGYYWGGITGLGISLIITYSLYLIHMIIVTRIKFGMHFGSKIWMLFFVLVLFIVISIFAKLILSGWNSYIIGSVLLIITATYSLYELNKRMDIMSLLKQKRK